MRAHDLLRELTNAGFRLTADGDRLVVSPRERLTDKHREAIRGSKSGLLAVLTSQVKRPPPPTIYSRETFEQSPADEWTGQELDAQDLAHARLIGMGLDDPRADKLAEWMTLRQESGDDRICCFECRHFGPRTRRCGNHVVAQMPRELGLDIATMPQRCAGFADLDHRFPMGFRTP